LPEKICALGGAASPSPSRISINVSNLGYFDNIIPCSIRGKAVTSLNVELGVESR
jgi:lipoyl(octanoyl) transferase